MASPYHQGSGVGGGGMMGGGHGSQMGGPQGAIGGMAGMGGLGGYSQPKMGGYFQPNMGGMSLDGHNINNDQQDQDGNPQDNQHQQQGSEFNIPVMCRIGQETVQEIVTKAQELFQILKTLQPPSGTMNAQALNLQEERKAKLTETLKLMQGLFKRLRRVYEICDQNGSGGEFSSLEPDVATIQLVPLEEERRKDEEEKKPSESMKVLLEERQKLEEQVRLKNKQMKEIIDMLRSIVCEINTMLAMRKKHLPFSNRVTGFKSKPPLF